MGLKGLVGLVLVVFITLGIGLLLIPMLTHYPATALIIVAIGLFLSNYLSVNLGKGAVAAFLTVGITLISAAGVASFPLAREIIEALALGITVAVVAQWLIYPLLPEDAAVVTPKDSPPGPAVQSNWTALRATLIVLPTYLMALSNPSLYLPIIMKSVSLGQQGSVVGARHAGRELLGSTFLGGCFAMLFWFALGLHVNLWMFFLWTLLFGTYFASKFYGVLASRFPPSFWQNVVVTMLILLGPAVADSASGKDVYKAFFVRMSLFVAVTLYAWFAVLALDYLRKRRAGRRVSSTPTAELHLC